MAEIKTEEEVRAMLAAVAAAPPPERDLSLLTAWQVKNIRTKAKLTQEQLATRLGVTPRTVQRWERGYITKLGSMAMRMIGSAP